MSFLAKEEEIDIISKKKDDVEKKPPIAFCLKREDCLWHAH